MPEVVGSLRTPRLASAPGTPTPGQLYYDTGLSKLLWWDSTRWVTASDTPTGAASGDLGGTYPSPTVVKSSADFTVGGQLLVPTQGAVAGLVLGTDTNLYRAAADQLATDDALYVADRLGIAVATADYARLNVGGTMTDISIAAGYGVILNQTFAPVNDLNRTYTGFHGQCSLDPTNVVGNLSGFVYGARGLAIYNGGGATPRTLANLIGVRGEVQTLNATGLVTNATGVYSAGALAMPITNYYGVRINAPTLSGGGTIGTAYGLYIPSYSGVVASTVVHAIYVAGGSSRFDGPIGLGVAPGSTVGRLVVPTGTTAADGIAFGTDTNLYRSAADTLKTDDSLNVVATLTVDGRLRTPRLAAAPSSPVTGEMYYDTVLNKLLWWNGTTWVTPTKTFRSGHTWAIPGALTAVTLPAIFIPVVGGQTATLVGARTKIGSGTNITAQIQRNGINLGSSFTITTTAATTSFSQALSDTDTLGVVLSAPTGSPIDLSMTLLLEHIV